MSAPVQRRHHHLVDPRLVDVLMTTVIRAVAALLIVLLAYLVIHLITAGAYELQPARLLTFLTHPPKSISRGGGVGPQLYNSLYILLLSLLITAPVGIAGGIYMAEYARPGRLLETLRLATDTLATLPSIVVGLFGLLVFVELTGWKTTRLGGALALTVINLPYAVRITEDAFRGVQRSLLEGSLALGATRWQSIRQVLFPAALPGLVTGLILISGRAFGEAAALLYTAGLGTPNRNWFNLNPFLQGETLSVHLFYYRQEATVPDANQIADGTAALLVLSVLIFNLAARAIGRYAVRRITAT